MKVLSKEMLITGLECRESPLRTLRAGDLQADYQSGFLRYIRIGKHEVLRLVNFALRDHNWETIPFRIVDESIDEQEDSFRIQYRALFQYTEIDYEAEVRIEGSANSKVFLTFDGLSKSDFRRNRIGFTVLHPLEECVGRELEATHTDGRVEHSRFPDLISPNQPLFDLAQLEWRVAGAVATLKFEGDVFEMEDQRNWTDASYKTYCTPLENPYPVSVGVGDRVKQRVCLSVSQKTTQDIESPNVESVIKLLKKRDWQSAPELGIGRSREIEQLSAVQRERLMNLGIAHYRLELDPEALDWKEKFDSAIAESDSMGVPIALAVFLGNIEDVSVVLGSLERFAPKIKSVLLLPKGCKVLRSDWVPVLVDRIRNVCPEVRIGAGTDAFFTELNRERLPANDLDFLSFSLNPQVHAFDNLSLVETLEAQGETVRTAWSFADKAKIYVGPVTLRMRWNPNATGAETVLKEDKLAGDVDLRQLSLFGAVWTFGSIASLGRAGATSISYYETVGERGVMQAKQPAHPDLFPALAGEVYPVYHVFREIAQARSLCFLDSSAPRRLAAVLIESASGTRLLLGNLCNEVICVNVAEVFEPKRIQCMDAESWCRLPSVRKGSRFPSLAFSQTLFELPAHAFAVLEGEEFLTF